MPLAEWTRKIWDCIFRNLKLPKRAMSFYVYLSRFTVLLRFLQYFFQYLLNFFPSYWLLVHGSSSRRFFPDHIPDSVSSSLISYKLQCNQFISHVLISTFSQLFTRFPGSHKFSWISTCVSKAFRRVVSGRSSMGFSHVYPKGCLLSIPRSILKMSDAVRISQNKTTNGDINHTRIRITHS